MVLKRARAPAQGLHAGSARRQALQRARRIKVLGLLMVLQKEADEPLHQARQPQSRLNQIKESP